MRMTHYFMALALLVAPALLATVGTGIWYEGGNLHLSVGLVAASLTVAAHTLVILFMIVTGKVMKAAMESRPLPPVFLEELNQFFAKKKAYPVAVFAAVAVTAVAVLGYAQHAFGMPGSVHMLLGMGAVLFNLWALQIEVQALRENQLLLDKTAIELDRIDRDSDVPYPEVEPQVVWHTPTQGWLIVAASAWAPYLYWVMVEWGGDFARVGATFPILTGAVSLGALVASWLTRGAPGPQESTQNSAQ